MGFHYYMFVRFPTPALPGACAAAKVFASCILCIIWTSSLDLEEVLQPVGGRWNGQWKMVRSLYEFYTPQSTN